MKLYSKKQCKFKSEIEFRCSIQHVVRNVVGFVLIYVHKLDEFQSIKILLIARWRFGSLK